MQQRFLLNRLGVIANIMLRAITVASLALPLNVLGQDYDAIKPGIVKIVSVSPKGKKRTGTGFVVKLESDTAFILTAHHVIVSDKNPKITFYSQRHAPLTAEVKENDATLDLSLLIVRGGNNLPEDVLALPLEADSKLRGGDEVATIGFPAGLGDWAVSKLVVGARRGIRLTLSGAIAEGNSGGPLFVGDHVAAMISSVEGIAGFATPAFILRSSLEGWGVDVAQPIATAPQSPTSDTNATGGVRQQDSYLSPVDPYLFEIITKDERIRGAWIVPLGQINMRNNSLVIAWPALTPEGHIIDNNAYGFMLERDRGSTSLNDIEKIYGNLSVFIEEKTKDNEYYIYNRNAGAGPNEIGNLIEKYIKALVSARQNGNYEEATRSAASLSRLFSFDIVNNPMTNLLIRALEHGGLSYIESVQATHASTPQLRFQTLGEGKRMFVTMDIGRLEDDDKCVVQSVTYAR
jgi:hypothetical protein